MISASASVSVDTAVLIVFRFYCDRQLLCELLCKYHDIMFHDESWKPIYFGVKVTSESTDLGICTLVSAGFL